MDLQEQFDRYRLGLLGERQRERFETRIAEDATLLGMLRDKLPRGLWDTDNQSRARALLALVEAFTAEPEADRPLPALTGPRLDLLPEHAVAPAAAPLERIAADLPALVRIVNNIVYQALRAGAQRIEVVRVGGPGPDVGRVAIRTLVDGERQELMTLPLFVLDGLTARLRTMADVEGAPLPARGRIPIRCDGVDYNLEARFEAEAIWIDIIRSGG